LLLEIFDRVPGVKFNEKKARPSLLSDPIAPLVWLDQLRCELFEKEFEQQNTNDD